MQRLHSGGEQRGEQHRDRDRHDDRREAADDDAEHVDRGDDDEQPPPQGGGDAQHPRHERPDVVDGVALRASGA